jgi:hypothetical protein
MGRRRRVCVARLGGWVIEDWLVVLRLELWLELQVMVLDVIWSSRGGFLVRVVVEGALAELLLLLMLQL